MTLPRSDYSNNISSGGGGGGGMYRRSSRVVSVGLPGCCLEHMRSGGPPAVACHQLPPPPTAISTPMGMKSENITSRVVSWLRYPRICRGHIRGYNSGTFRCI